MLKMLKKYRNDPKRMVITFSCQKKMTLNRLGDLTEKNKIQNELNAKAGESLSEKIEQRMNDVACGCENTVDESNASCDCGESYGDYITEADDRYLSKDKLKSKRVQVEREQAQILERDECCVAFKQNYHIKPLDYSCGNTCDSKEALKPQREMRGGVVMEKSLKVLLCDLLTALGVTVAIICVLSKMKKTFKG